MKKTFVYFLLTCFFATNTQANSETEKVPLDSAIRHGVLENGLTYYVRHNEEPKDRASFYMVQNVGAILENDEQNGLAHFLEHMAFNGLEHFRGKAMLNYLEKNGVTFGRDINAYTAQDETVYNLSNVPTTNPQLIDSCLWILHDWSNYLLLENEEIDAERGVITEEWRTRRDARFRMRNIQNNALYFDSKYSKRDVIGDLDVIKNFEYQTIKDFYHDWYRTDLQAVIVVGDIDVDAIEKMIKERFSKIKTVKNPKERKHFEVPDNKEPRFVLSTDKEAGKNYINISFKYDPVKPENKGKAYLRQIFIQNLFSSIMNDRLQEPLQKSDPPYMGAQVYNYPAFRTKSIAGFYISFKDENALPSLEAASTILEQARDFGFTQEELDRAKTNLLSSYENAYKKRDKVKHDRFAMEYKDHYLSNEPIAGIKYELEFLKSVLPQITLEEVSTLTKNYFKDENMLIAVAGPEKEGAVYPTKEEVLEVVNRVKITKLEAYIDSYKEKALISEIPKAGKIVKRIKIEKLNAEELELSNGIKVFVKQSDLEKEKIVFKAHSWGGISVLENSEIPNSMVFGDFINSYGIGDFSVLDLQKALTGKIVSVRPNLGNLSEGINGSAAPKDLETMFQLLHLYFTAPRFDQESYDAMYARYMSYTKNLGNDIKKAFKDSILLTMANHHPRVMPLSESILKDVSFKGIQEIYYDRFGNPGDFTFTFSGDFEIEVLNELIETYLASLPTTDQNESYVDNNIKAPANNTKNHFKLEMGTPKSSVYVNLHKEYKYSYEDKYYLYIISQLLSKKYLDEIREKEGGTYGVSVRPTFKDHPYDEIRMSIKFDCDPDKADKLKSIALNEVEKLMGGEIVEVDLEEIKKNIIKNIDERENNLGYWHGKLTKYASEGKITMLKEELEVFLLKIDSNKIIEKVNQLLKDTKKVEVIMSAL